MASTPTGWISNNFGSFWDQFFDHEGDDSAWYQPQQGGLATILDHFGISFLIMRVMILHGINPNRVD